MKWKFAALIVTVGLSHHIYAEPSKPTVAVTVVKYDGLTDMIKKNSGKVILVDFWADYCLPCKKEFPKLVALHKKLAKDGLLAISVSLDEMEDGTKDRVLEFLTQKQATLTNLILDEKPEVWQKKFQVEGPPLVMVFNRKGELAKKFVDKEVDYEQIEKLVTKLVGEPANDKR